ncbi:hypothetical protein JR316_0006654 [Psilocybe cubensis]|uniref:C2H2-type domain-containing protein n=2 Tax=Psilocybe cubensis TaxID=181762 RepID=A0A8H7XNS1_PSICU|nr:hypothetical protein JR316_0006654 [Psilocybe cubensis]KAH9480057.1 hypothetical protein JR316_0006654 [Psilocybe cubensis]
MVDREELLQDDASPATPRTYTGRFRIDNRPVDDNSDGTPQPPSYVPSAIARKIMKGSKRGKGKSSQGSSPSPVPTYRIIRGPPSDIGPPSRRHDGSSQMSSRSISVPSESEPPSTSVTRVSSPDREASSAGPSSSRSSPWGMPGSTSPRRRTQTSKLRNVMIAQDPASPQYCDTDVEVEVEVEAPPSPPYVPHPHPPATPPPRVFPPRSSHPSVSTSLRHASLPPSLSYHHVPSHTRHPSLPPDTASECPADSRYPSVPPSTPPSLTPRLRHPSLRSASPWPYPASPSKNPPLRPRSSHSAILPRPPSQRPASPSLSSPPPLPAPAPPIASSTSASTSASTSTDTNTNVGRRRAKGNSKSNSSDGSSRPPTEAIIHCQWESCKFVITGIQNFGKHLKQEHRLPVVQHGRQSGPVVQCNWGQCGVEIAGLELYIHILQIHLKFGYHCRGLQKDGKSRCEYRPNRLDTLERHYKAIHPGEKRQWDETLLAVLPPR